MTNHWCSGIPFILCASKVCLNKVDSNGTALNLCSSITPRDGHGPTIGGAADGSGVQNRTVLNGTLFKIVLSRLMEANRTDYGVIYHNRGQLARTIQRVC